MDGTWNSIKLLNLEISSSFLLTSTYGALCTFVIVGGAL